MTDSIPIGSHVRVRSGCPHTLPYYARTQTGEVVEPAEAGHLLIRFGERFFPVDAAWLEVIADALHSPDDV